MCAYIQRARDLKATFSLVVNRKNYSRILTSEHIQVPAEISSLYRLCTLVAALKTAIMTAAKVKTAIDIASTAVGSAVDIYSKLRNSFKISDDTRQQSKKCQSEIEKLKFKNFHERHSCKSMKQIPMDEFEGFVTERLQKRLNFPDHVKESLLDGLYGGENEEKVNDFQFKDGKGNIHHGRFITMKRDGKMDIAYAMYTLSFELAEKEVKRGSYDWWFSILPVWSETVTKEIQGMSENQKDMFSKWCQVKLYNCVAQECLKE